MTPGTEEIVAVTEGSSGWSLIILTMKSALRLPVVCLARTDPIEVPITVTAVTRVKPSMRAAVVEAVRRGLRRAFSVASLPSMPNHLVNGLLSSPSSGLDKNGVRMTSAMFSSPAPAPM